MYNEKYNKVPPNASSLNNCRIISFIYKLNFLRIIILIVIPPVDIETCQNVISIYFDLFAEHQ